MAAITFGNNERCNVCGGIIVTHTCPDSSFNSTTANPDRNCSCGETVTSTECGTAEEKKKKEVHVFPVKNIVEKPKRIENNKMQKATMMHMRRQR